MSYLPRKKESRQIHFFVKENSWKRSWKTRPLKCGLLSNRQVTCSSSSAVDMVRPTFRWKASWSIKDEDYVWFQISGQFHSLADSSIRQAREHPGPVGRASINQVFILPSTKDWLLVRKESKWMELCGHSCLSHKKGLFATQDWLTLQELCPIKEPLLCKSHPGWMLSERWQLSSVSFMLSLLWTIHSWFSLTG